MCTTVSLGAAARWNGADISTRSFVSRRSRDPEGEVGRRFEGGHPIATSMRSRAALTGKHDTLVRRAHQMLNAALMRSCANRRRLLSTIMYPRVVGFLCCLWCIELWDLEGGGGATRVVTRAA